MAKEPKSVEHVVNETYLDLAVNSPKLRNFLVGEVEETAQGYKVKVITCVNPNDWDLGFEDMFRAKVGESIPIEDFEVEKVSMKRFIERTLKLEDILGRKISCNFLDPSDPAKFSKDLFNIAEELRSSDVHIYPAPSATSFNGIIKMRVDGRLRDIKHLSEQDFFNLTNYLHERVPEIKTATDKKSLEGSFFLDGQDDTSYRLSSMQVNASKATRKERYSTVVRILKTKDITYNLGQLGYSRHDEEKIRNMIRERSGVIAVVGKVGMGKSTTLASVITEISDTNRGEVKIVTLEDPVEYHIPCALQIKVTAKEDAQNELTYTEAFKNCLRQDPDVMMIGETRNEATTKHLFDLAHTGNLALTTFHARDIANAFTRLVSYGIDGPTMCGSLLGIISQILIRQNCDQCLETRRMDLAERNHFFQKPIGESKDYDEFIKRNLLPEVAVGTGVHNGKICSKCEGTGLFNRRPLVEIYTHSVENDEILHAICNKSPDGRKKLKALFKNGICEPFALGALNMIFQQSTSPKEVMKVLPPSYFTDYCDLLVGYTNRVIGSAQK